MANTDVVSSSSLFSSTDNNTNRLSSHVPWGNNRTYIDQGSCCGHPARLSGVISITTTLQYIWQYIGTPSAQHIIQDDQIRLSDAGSGTYNNTVNPSFALSGWAKATNSTHNGRVFEGFFIKQH